MNPAGKRSMLISAVAGGVVAGALLAVKRPRPSSQLAVISAPEPAVRLPALREFTESPVIYEARIETPKSKRWLAWLCAPAALALGIPFALAERPQLSIGAPPSVAAGTAGTISYSASGNGTVQATLDAGSYHRAVRLSKRSGTIDVPARATHSGSDILATLSMRGPFGSDAQVVRIHVRAARAPARIASNAPVITQLALSKPSARGGERIFVHYDTNATAGSIRMTDASGVVWLSRPVRGRGIASIVVPRMHADAPFIVAVQAQRGGRSVTASAGFVALAVQTPEKAVTAGADAPPATFTLPATVHGGAALAIPVPHGLSAATISLSAANGTAVLASAAQTQNRLLLEIPSVSSPTKAFATLSYQRGKSRETIIRRVTIAP